MVKLKFIRYKILLICLFGFLSFIAFYHKVSKSCSETGVYEYNAEIDKEFIVNMFKNHWYWLVSGTSNDFSPEYMLENRAIANRPESKGTLEIKVYHVESKPVGFIAYFMKKFHQGYILFLAVDENYRNKGYAKELMNYAIQDLKNHGAYLINLVTRTSNLSARSVYKKTGFEQIEDDGQFVRYRKILN